MIANIWGWGLALATVLHAASVTGVRFDQEAPGRFRAEVRGFRLTLDGRGVGYGGARVRLLGAHSTVPVGEAQAAGRTSYLIGAPADWRVGISSYSRVRYAQVYPGIDLIFHGASGPIEYDFVVAPGADPARIGLRVEGAQPQLTVSGDLKIAGVRWRRPHIYQGADTIAGGFRVHSDQEAEILYKGAVPGQTAGLLQINVRIPAGTPAGNLPLVVTVGTASNPAGLTVVK